MVVRAYVCFFKKIVEICKMKFVVILQVFLLIIMIVWNVKQTIVKNYNIHVNECCAIAFAISYVKNTYLQPLVVG